MNPVLVAVIERLMDDIGDKIAVDVPMGALTTYRVGGRAAAMVVVDDHETLSAVAAAVAAVQQLHTVGGAHTRQKIRHARCGRK